MPLARGRECSWSSVATAAILSVIRARGSWRRAPDKMPAKAIQGPRADEALPVSAQHHEGDSRRGGGGESSADAARRPHPPPRCRSLQLAADGPQGAAEGGAHHPRGNEPRGSVRARDAGDPAGGAVAGVGPLEGV